MNTRSLIALLSIAAVPFVTAQTQAPASASAGISAPPSGAIADAPDAAFIVPAPAGQRAHRNADGTYSIVGAANAADAGGTSAPAGKKAKKPPVSAGGTWKWTTYNGSLQPCENVLTLTVGKNGKISGKLIDRTGEHDIKDATLGDGVVTFELKVHTRGEGDLPHTYTVNLDPDNLQVSVDQPDLTPFGKSHGGKHHSDHSAKHDTSG